MDKNQRDYFLREQMHVIQNELGEGDMDDDDVAGLLDKIQAIQTMPDDTREKLKKEAEKLYKMPPGSQGSKRHPQLFGCLFGTSVGQRDGRYH